MNRRFASVGLLAAAALMVTPTPARPCGGGFGDNVVVQPKQHIVVGMAEGVESYIFNPFFCGQSRDFGLILPLPAALTVAPTTVPTALFDELAAFTAPEVVKECRSNSGGCGAAAANSKAVDGQSNRSVDSDVSVIDAGRVGILDWTLLRADSQTAFTDWLDANAYRFDPERDAPLFGHYVTQGWYFVAFKVHVDVGVDQGEVCGQLGPLMVQFPSATPVVPARIAAAGGNAYEANIWRVYVASNSQVRLRENPDYAADLYFAGGVSEQVLRPYATVASVLPQAAYLTTLDIHFPYGNVTHDDIRFVDEPSPAAFRSTVVEYEECGCQAASSSGLQIAVWGGIGMMLTALARRWRQARCQ